MFNRNCGLEKSTMGRIDIAHFSHAYYELLHSAQQRIMSSKETLSDTCVLTHVTYGLKFNCKITNNVMWAYKHMLEECDIRYHHNGFHKIYQPAAAHILLL